MKNTTNSPVQSDWKENYTFFDGDYCKISANIKNTGKTSNELADLILEKAGVSLLPGSCFGDFGEGYLRLSYATSIPTIEKGLARIQSVLG